MIDPLQRESEDGLEQLLAQSMQALPERRWGGGADLAAAALARARLQQLREARLQSMSRRMRWINVIGAVLLAIVLGAGMYWEAWQNSATSTETSSTQAGSTEDGKYADAAVAGMVLLLLLAAGIVAKRVLSEDRGPASWESMMTPE